ncbi:MAG: hypothetical protein ACI8O8_000685 [Oleiphilaceae bacterium]|jgi:hypothetical protein
MFSQKSEFIVSQSNSERRNHPRFLAPQLSVSLLAINTKTTNDKNTISNKYAELKTLDFNYLGMSVYSQEHFNIGDALHLAISNEGNRAIEVRCFVCNRARTDLGYRSGLHFLNPENDNRDSNASSTALIAIEQSLDTVNE